MSWNFWPFKTFYTTQLEKENRTLGRIIDQLEDMNDDLQGRIDGYKSAAEAADIGAQKVTTMMHQMMKIMADHVCALHMRAEDIDKQLESADYWTAQQELKGLIAQLQRAASALRQAGYQGTRLQGLAEPEKQPDETRRRSE